MSNTVTSLRDLDNLADRIRQHQQASDLPVLILEGPDDELVLQPHLESVDLFPAGGKRKVVRAVRQLLEWNLGRFLYIVDSDFDSPAEYADIATLGHPYLRRDLEAMLIDLGALCTLLEHYGSSDKLAVSGGAAQVVRELEDCIEPVTILRVRNSRDNLGLAFDKVDLASKIDLQSMELKLQSFCTALLAASESSLRMNDLLSTTEETELDDLGPRGKDVLVAAGVALRKRVGSHQKAATDEALLTSALHLSSGLALSRSSWMQDLRDRLHCLR